MQTIGGVLFLSSCCVCSLTGLWDPVWSRSETVREVTSQHPIGVPLGQLLQDPGRAGVMVTVMFSTVGGLAMAAAGLGMQADRPRGPGWALGIATTLLLVLLAGGVGLWIGQTPFLFRVWHGVLTLIIAALSGFCLVAWRQGLAHPPAADTGQGEEEFIDGLQRDPVNRKD